MSRIYLSPPHMSGEELGLVKEAFETNWISPVGPHVDAFERELADKVGVADAAVLSSGTAALHLALLLLGVEADDDVLCSSLTFSASTNAIAYVGAHPVLIDSEETSWNLDPDLVREELMEAARRGKLPKALIAVDLYGQCADYSKIEKACSKFGVPVIEDAAEGLGATYQGRAAGSFGVFSVLSFNGNKIITCGGGGALLSNDRAALKKARFLATQARDPAPHYEHSEIGYNYRLSNVLAAIGRGQLRVLDDRVDARRANFDYYQSALGALPGIEFMPEMQSGRSTRWLTCMTIDNEEFGVDRETVRLALEAENIEARPVWKPMHCQPVFRDCRVVGGGVSERLFENGLCLPSGSSLTESDLSRIVDIFRSCQR